MIGVCEAARTARASAGPAGVTGARRVIHVVVDETRESSHCTGMQVRLPGRRTVVAHAFPSSDPAFAAEVSTTLESERTRTTDAEDLREAVARSLRRAYPNARVVVQDDLGHLLPAQETWYVFRDAAVRARSDERERLYTSLAAARRTIAHSVEVLRDSDTTGVRAGYPPRDAEPDGSTNA
jgi:hypothetical protein